MWVTNVAIGIAVAGIVAGAVVGMSFRSFAVGVPIVLDLWMAGGLLQLSAEKAWTAILIAGLVVALRKLVTWGLRARPIARLAPGLDPLAKSTRE